jgi:hypothetical protein
MIVYQCCKCNKIFTAQSPKVCPYCQNKKLTIVSNKRVNISDISDIKSNYRKYSLNFNINKNETLSEILCNILRLPSISIRHFVSNPYLSRTKRCSSAKSNKVYETPITVELRIYSPRRAYVLLDTEDNNIFDYLVSQYTAHGWKVLDVRKSQISFIKIIRHFLKYHVTPRLKNDVIKKEIECITQCNGVNDNDDNNC